ncbi:hypothetical protein KQ51_01391 [Candidatus Izimaplasma bacterium HR1]|nr:hypothetical protein KQ51_01391 [Candidatus Izimaplasma bacterium HR1]
MPQEDSPQQDEIIDVSIEDIILALLKEKTKTDNPS